MAILLVILLFRQGEAHKFIILGKPDRDLSCKEDKKIVLPIPSLLSSWWHMHFPGEGSQMKEGGCFSGGSRWVAHLPICSPAGREGKTFLWLGRCRQFML